MAGKGKVIFALSIWLCSAALMLVSFVLLADYYFLMPVPIGLWFLALKWCSRLVPICNTI